MSDTLNIYLLDESNNIILENNIEKPKTYEKLLDKIKSLKRNNDIFPEHFIIFYKTEKNTDMKISNNEDYKKIKDSLFIQKTELKYLDQSVYQINYDKLSESKQDILDEKYNCFSCFTAIKNENPYFCYICQKIFHRHCLENWDKVRRLHHKILNCPNCRNELPLNQWKQKLDFEEDRKNVADVLNKINKYKLNNDLNNNINMINEKKINNLKDQNINQNNTIENYIKYIEKISLVFKNILTKIKDINYLIRQNKDYKLINLIDENVLSFNNTLLDDISKEIFEELDFIEKYIKQNNNPISNNNLNNNNKENEKFDNTPKFFNPKERNKPTKLKEFKDEINLIYTTYEEDTYYILGTKFIENNKDNIEIFISGNKIPVTYEYKLNKGTNIVKIKIKNKINNLSHMFQDCNTLTNIDELKFLDTKNVKDFSHMFNFCRELKDIKALKHWNVSNGNNFEYMFCECRSLTDISPLKNWNVSNGNNFQSMFSGCANLTNIKPLEEWNVSNVKNFSYMFYYCLMLTDITPLKNWKVSPGSNLNNMFCSSKVSSNANELLSCNIF